jgi:O-antigen ligase
VRLALIASLALLVLLDAPTGVRLHDGGRPVPGAKMDPALVAARTTTVVAAQPIRPQARRANQDLIRFLRSGPGLVGVISLATAIGVGSFVVIFRMLRAKRPPDQRKRSSGRRKRGSRGNTAQRDTADAAVVEAAVAATLVAGCAVLPLLFTIALEDVFALPKTVALCLLAVVAGILMAVAVTRGARLVRLGVVDIAVTAFVLLNVVATVLSVDPNQSIFGERLQYQGLLSMLAYIVLFVSARFALAEIRQVRLLSAAILAAATAAAIYAVAQWVGLDPIWSSLYKERVFSTVGQANALATVLGMALILGLALIARQEPRIRAVLGGAVAIVAVALLLTFSRGGYLGTAAGLAVCGAALVPGASWMRVRPYFPRAAVMFGATALGLASIAIVWKPANALVTQIAGRAASIGNPSETSILSHVDLWAVGIRIAADHPVLGTGPDTYVLVFPEYRDQVLPSERAAVMARFRPESPHNVFIAVAAGSGLPSLAAYVTIILACLARAARAARGERPLETRLMLAALVGTTVVYLVTSSFMTAEVSSTAIFWVVLGSAAGLADRVLSA